MRQGTASGMTIWAAELLPVIYALACNCAIAIICKEVFMRPDPEEDVAGFRTPYINNLAPEGRSRRDQTEFLRAQSETGPPVKRERRH